MIRLKITAQNTEVKIQIPEEYVGRELEVMIYAVDEIHNEKKRHKDFRGKLKLTDEQYQDFQNHVREMREE